MEQLPARTELSGADRRTALDTRRVRQLSSVPPSGGYVEIDSAVIDADAEWWNKWLQYWYALTRHKVAVLVTALVGVAVAFVVTLFQTPLFVANTTLEFQAQGSQQQPFESISFMDTFDPYLIQTQVQLLRSGMFQGRVYAKLSDRAQNGRLPAPHPLQAVRSWLRLPASSSEREEAVAYAMANLKVVPMKDTRIVQIVSQSTLPQVAADYVNTLAEEFIRQNLEERWSRYQMTGTWLARAQEDLRSKLEESERQALTYAAESGLVVTSDEQSIAEQKLLQVQTEVSRAQADRIAKESVYRTAMAQPAESLAEVLDQGPMIQYQAKLADLRRELADATTSLTAAHPRVKRLEAQIAELESAKSRESRSILTRMRTEYESALRREKQLLAGFADQSRVLSSQDQKLIRYKMLQREVDTYRKLYETTLQKGKEASVASALRPINARIVDSAHAAKRPSSPNVTTNLIYGLFGGLFIGVVVVLLRERTDVSIRVPGSVSLQLNLRELGVIPSAKTDPDLLLSAGKSFSSLPSPTAALARRPGTRLRTQIIDSVELATWNRKSSIMAEAFRATITSILASEHNGRERRVILVTSPSPQEGKSTVVTNLAIALAEIDQRVLLIDADMRRPRLHSILNLANTWGLSDLLREKTPCTEYQAEALARKTHIPRLFLLPSGPGSANVSKLLYSARMAELLSRLRNDFDAVLIDTPPVSQVTDARILSRLADAVVLVFRAGKTTRDAATMAVNVFDGDGVPVLGTVLNDWNPRMMGHGYYPSNYLDPYGYASTY